MEQCQQHTDMAVSVGELKTIASRNVLDIQALWNSHHEMQNDIKKMLYKIAYISGGSGMLTIVAVALLEYFKK